MAALPGGDPSHLQASLCLLWGHPRPSPSPMKPPLGVLSKPTLESRHAGCRSGSWSVWPVPAVRVQALCRGR